MSIVNHPFMKKQVKLITEIIHAGILTTIDDTILSSKNKRYWIMPVQNVGLVLYDTKTSSHEILVQLGVKRYDTIGLRFLDGVITFFGRTTIPNVFDRQKLNEYDIWKSPQPKIKAGPYSLEVDSIGVLAVYDDISRKRVFPVLEIK